MLDSFLYLQQSGLEFRDFHHATRTRLVSHFLGEHNSAADALANAGADGHTLEQFDWPAIRDLWACPCNLLLSFDGAARGNPAGHTGAGCALWIAAVMPDGQNAAWRCVAQASAYLGMLSNNSAEMYSLLMAHILLIKFLRAVRRGN